MECRFVCIVFNHLVIVRTEANRRVEWITSDGGAFHFPVLTICWLVSHLYLCWIDGWWSVSITQRHTATGKLNVSRRQNIFIASHSLALFELGVEFVRIRSAWIVLVSVFCLFRQDSEWISLNGCIENWEMSQFARLLFGLPYLTDHVCWRNRRSRWT